MLVVITIALVLSLTACCKIPKEENEAHRIAKQALEEMELEDAEDVRLYFMQENEQGEKEWLLLADDILCHVKSKDGNVISAEKNASFKFVFKGGDDNV